MGNVPVHLLFTSGVFWGDVARFSSEAKLHRWHPQREDSLKEESNIYVSVFYLIVRWLFQSYDITYETRVALLATVNARVRRKTFDIHTSARFHEHFDPRLAVWTTRCLLDAVQAWKNYFCSWSSDSAPRNHSVIKAWKRLQWMGGKESVNN